MTPHELLPIAGGVTLGCIARYAYTRPRRWIYFAAVIVIALCATIVSGEFRQSWGFLVDDLLFVAGSACVAFLLSGLLVEKRMVSKD